MADPFTPRFVDLVRNFTTTVGTGNLVLGDAAPGFTSFSSALQPGDTFYYSVAGLEKTSETEVGRGTLQADGSIARAPMSGVLTDFSLGRKTVALVAAAEWYRSIEALRGAAASAATRAALAGVGTTGAALLTEGGREGLFVFDGSNLSAKVAADTRQGIYVAPSSDVTGANGAWVRQSDGPIFLEWFGGGTSAADNLPAFQAATALVGACTILLHPGIYAFDHLQIPADVNVHGAGRGASEIMITGDGGGAAANGVNGGVRMFSSQAGLFDLTLSYNNPALLCLLNISHPSSGGRISVARLDFTIRGGMTPAQVQATAVYMANLSQTRFSECQIGQAPNFKQNMQIRGFWNGCWVKNVTFRPHGTDVPNGVFHNANYHLDIDASTQSSTISDCVFEGGPNGIRIAGQGVLTFDGNYMGDVPVTKGFWRPNLAVDVGDATHGVYLYPSSSVTGTTTASGFDLTSVSSTAALYVGQKLVVPGAGAAGAELSARITAISGTTVTLDTAASTALVGTAVYYGSYAGRGYRCIVTGTTGTTQPLWPTATGGTVVDGTVTWREYGACAWIDTPGGKDGINISGGVLTQNICGIVARASPSRPGSIRVDGVYFNRPEHAGQFDGVGACVIRGCTLRGYSNVGFEFGAATAVCRANEVGPLHILNGGTADVVATSNSTSVGGAVRGQTVLTGVGKSKFTHDHTSSANALLSLPGSLELGGGAVLIMSGTGTPEGAVTAGVGSLYLRTNGTAATTLYVKESGTGNSGWVPSGLTISATDKILGRQSAGSGAVEEITCTAAARALLDDGNAGEQRTTLGLKRGLAFHCAGVPANGEVLGGGIAPYAMTLAAGNSSCKSLAAATAALTLLIKQNGIQIGSIDFAAGGTVGTVSLTGTEVTAGDHITIHNAATADATLGDIDGLLAE